MRLEELKDIEPVGVIVQDGNDHGLIESKDIQGISTLPVGTKIYTAEQMQEYAKVERDYIIVIDGGLGTKLHVEDVSDTVVAVDIYGDQSISNDNKWILQEVQDEEVNL